MNKYTLLNNVVQCSGREDLSITSQDPSVSKSNRLHVNIFRFFFINVR